MTIRNKSVDKAHGLISSDIEKACEELNGYGAIDEQIHVRMLKLRVLADIKYEFDAYITNNEKNLKKLHGRDIFPAFVQVQLKSLYYLKQETMLDYEAHFIYQFKSSILVSLVVKYDKLV